MAWDFEKRACPAPGDPLRATFASGAGATLRFMLPLSGLPRRPEIWYHILAHMGVTVLFVAGVTQLLGKLRSSPVKPILVSGERSKGQVPRPAHQPSHSEGQRRRGKTPV